MARSKAATKKAKAAYSRRYRKTAAGKAKVKAYGKRTVKQRASRNKARAMVAKKVGKAKLKGKDIHHKDSNPRNNSKKNLRVVRGHHSGGTKGKNRNAAKRK